MKSILTVLFFLLLQPTFGQVRRVNIDSLFVHVKTNFIQGQPRAYLQESFAVFESPNKLEAVHIFLDSLNRPNDYIGLCAVYYRFDSLFRVRSIEGWNRAGKPSYWDFAPLSTFEYRDISTSAFVRKLEQSVPDFNVAASPVLLCVEQEIYPDSLRKYGQTNYEVNTLDGTWKLRYYSKPAKGMRTVCDSAWFVLKHLDSNFRVVEEYFFGLDTTLMDGFHVCQSFYSTFAPREGDVKPEMKYSSAKKINDGALIEIHYFDKHQQVVFIRGRTRGNIELKGILRE